MGQKFTPNIGISPDQGPISEISLTQFALYHGNGGKGAASATTYLNVFDGDPNVPGSVIVASSSNSIHTNTVSVGDAMVWEFGDLALDDMDECWTVMSPDNARALGIGLSSFA